jgi:hypothetical protein
MPHPDRSEGSTFSCPQCHHERIIHGNAALSQKLQIEVQTPSNQRHASQAGSSHGRAGSLVSVFHRRSKHTRVAGRRPSETAPSSPVPKAPQGAGS